LKKKIILPQTDTWH